MKKLQGPDRTLESFRIFPYVAWTLTIVFALFVYNIALNLQEVAERLQTQTDELEEKVSQYPGNITDFGN